MYNSYTTLIEKRKQDDLYRLRKKLSSDNGKEIVVEGKKRLNFSSNNYLNLANHSTLQQAFCRCAEKYGMGAGASQFISGYTDPLGQLEKELALFTGRDRAIVFSSGYLANLAAVTALSDRGKMILIDKLAHASLVDAALLSRAKFKRYHHVDKEFLLRQLKQSRTDEKLVLTEGVFSMDGDIAPLPALTSACHETQSLLLVDDAHGIGVLGKNNGAGVLEHFGIRQEEVPLLTGTFAKAFGLSGAFVAGPEVLIETILQQGRSAIYTTAMMPALAAAVSAALKLIQTEAWRREKLFELIQYFKQEAQKVDLKLLPSITPIQPLMLGSNQKALAISRALFESGFYVPAIRPPTVPKGTARLRISITAGHEKEEIKSLVAAISKLTK